MNLCAEKWNITFLFLRCILHHPNATALEEWISSKDYSDDKPLVGPKWHIPSVEEVKFANELLDLHFRSALDDLLRICQTKVHSDPGKFFFLVLIPDPGYSLSGARCIRVRRLMMAITLSEQYLHIDATVSHK